MVVRRYTLGSQCALFLFLQHSKEKLQHFWKKCTIQGRGAKQHMEIEYWEKEQGERLVWIGFCGFSSGGGWEGKKHAYTHTIILTHLSLPDLRVMEVWCVILMKKNHTDTRLVKMWKEKCILLLFTFQKECVRNRRLRQTRRKLRKKTD